MRVWCSKCGDNNEVNPKVWERAVQAALSVPCNNCSEDLRRFGERTRHKGRSDSQRRSQDQEKRAARRRGGRRQVGSGSRVGAKGDVRRPGKYREECKLTRSKSFTLKLADLKKIEAEASLGENPVLSIEFQGQYPVERFVVIPESLYEYYARLAGDI